MLGIVFLICLFYFRVGISRGLSYVSHSIFRPVLIAGNFVGQEFLNVESYFFSKKTLYTENENLKLRVSQNEAQMLNYDSVSKDNIDLKEILGRKKTNQDLLVSAILSKPNRSLYDTLIIDAGKNQGVAIDQRVFALGNIPIGRIVEVYANSSKVILYSNPGEKTEIVISGKNTFMQIIGRGGGNFEIILPKNINLDNGTEVTLPGITPYVVATVIKTVSDPRDSFTKALLASPVNIQNLKFVEVEK